MKTRLGPVLRRAKRDLHLDASFRPQKFHPLVIDKLRAARKIACLAEIPKSPTSAVDPHFRISFHQPITRTVLARK